MTLARRGRYGPVLRTEWLLARLPVLEAPCRAQPSHSAKAHRSPNWARGLCSHTPPEALFGRLHYQKFFLTVSLKLLL